MAAKLLSVSMLAASLMFGAAEAADGQPLMAGLGGQQCGAWTANGGSSASEGIGLLYLQWALGFLSGVVFSNHDHWPNGVDVAAVNASIDEFCRTNPTSTIADALTTFVRNHRP
jgi:hypothetical protein